MRHPEVFTRTNVKVEFSCSNWSVLADPSGFDEHGAIGNFVTFSRSLSVFLCFIRRDVRAQDWLYKMDILYCRKYLKISVMKHR